MQFHSDFRYPVTETSLFFDTVVLFVKKKS